MLIRLLVVVAISFVEFFGSVDGKAVKQHYATALPHMATYQNEEACFANPEMWYLVYRSFEYDPAFGGNARCARGIAVNPCNGSGTISFQYGQDQAFNASVTFKSSKGYKVRNYMQLNFPSGQDTYSNHDFRVYSLYTDCSTCSVFWSNYVEEGPACSLVVPESSVDNIPQHCHYIYDMHCGPTKYWIYDKSCGSKD
ncbi:hypothetical protein ISCGN_012020 [Ixodes scapularis]